MFLRNRFRIGLLAGLLVAVAGCASDGGPRPGMGDPTFEESKGAPFRDWAQLDWQFPRDILILTYLFDMLPPRDPYADYCKAVTYDESADSLGLGEFELLDAGAQAERQGLAVMHRNQALALRRAQQSWWQRVLDNPGGFSPTNTPPEFAGDGVTMAIGHLVAAVGLNPGNALAWYDLSYLYGLAGDTERMAEAHEAGLTALMRWELMGRDPAEVGTIRVRLLLDRAWGEREEGRFDACLASVMTVAGLIRTDNVATPDLAFEARVLHALVLVELGHTSGARRLANNLPVQQLPQRQKDFISDSERYRAVHKKGWQSIESDFARRWVRATVYRKLGQRNMALSQYMEPDFRTEFPTHLNHRFWNDAGRVQEHFGEIPAARLNYAIAAVYRPLFVYFPMVGARGTPVIYGQAGAGRLYFLGYQHFYLGGSLFSFAANRVLAVELAPDDRARQDSIIRALAALDTCLRWGIRPAATLALRGRVLYRAGEFEAAATDLAEARDQLRALGRDDADVHLLLGILRFNGKNYRDAASVFADYTGMRPDEALGWRMLGLALIHAGQYEQALEALDRALELDPDAPAGLYNRALLHLQMGRVEPARADLAKAQQFWPGNADFARLADLVATDDVPNITLAHDELDVTLETEAPPQPIDEVEAAPVRLLGSGSGALQHLGMTPDDAAALLTELRKRYVEESSRAHRTAYAWALLQAGRPRDVARLLEPFWGTGLGSDEVEILLNAERELGVTTHARALTIGLGRGVEGPDDPDIWELVGAICLENGAVRTAALAFDRALQLDPHNAHLERLRAQLER